MTVRYEIVKTFFEIVRDDIEVEWRTASLSPILTVSPQKCPAFYVFDFQENVVQQTKTHDAIKAQLFIIIEFWIKNNITNNASEESNIILDKIQRKFQTTAGHRFNRKIQRISEVSNKFKMASVNERIAACEIVFEVDYIRTNDNQ